MTGKLTIGYTLPDAGSGYQPTLDGYRHGEAQQSAVEPDLAYCSRRWPGGRAARIIQVTAPPRWAEALYTSTNASPEVLHPRLAVRLKWVAIRTRPATLAAMRPVCVGDTVTVAGHTLGCTRGGWVPVPGPGTDDPG